MAASFAVFSVAVLIWVTPSGHVVERVALKQLSPTPFAELNACRDDLKNKITSRLASAAHAVSDTVKASVHFDNPDDHLARIRDVVVCLRVPPSADVLDALTE